MNGTPYKASHGMVQLSTANYLRVSGRAKSEVISGLSRCLVCVSLAVDIDRHTRLVMPATKLISTLRYTLAIYFFISCDCTRTWIAPRHRQVILAYVMSASAVRPR